MSVPVHRPVKFDLRAAINTLRAYGSKPAVEEELLAQTDGVGRALIVEPLLSGEMNWREAWKHIGRRGLFNEHERGVLASIVLQWQDVVDPSNDRVRSIP